MGRITTDGRIDTMIDTAIMDQREVALAAARALDAKRGKDIVVLLSLIHI